MSGRDIFTKPTDGYISRYINRKISMRVTMFIVKHKIPLTPNIVSLISFLMALTSAILFLSGNLILAGVLAQLSSIIDGVDGELARILGLSSPLGAFLDSMLDRIADIAIISAMSIYAYSIQGSSLRLLVTSLAALSGALLVSYMHSKSVEQLGKHPALIGRIRNFASRDMRLFIIFIGSIIGRVYETLLVLAIISYVYVMLKLNEIYIRVKYSF